MNAVNKSISNQEAAVAQRYSAAARAQEQSLCCTEGGNRC